MAGTLPPPVAPGWPFLTLSLCICCLSGWSPVSSPRLSALPGITLAGQEEQH